MSKFEQEYQSRINALTPKQRIGRAVALFDWSRDVIARQILADSNGLNPDRLKWHVALRLYGADPAVRRLIESKLCFR